MSFGMDLFRAASPRARIGLLIWIGTAACASYAQDMTVPLIQLSASSDQGTASLLIDITEGNWDPTTRVYRWTLPAATQLVDDVSGEPVATLTAATVQLRNSSEFQLNYTVRAGAAETTIKTTTLPLSFPAINPAEGRATATIAIVDENANGAELHGIIPSGSGAFRALYNTFNGGGRIFTEMIGLISVGAGGTARADQWDPLIGYRPIGQPVSDMCVETAFRLTSGDTAVVTTKFDVRPDPDPCLGDLNGDTNVDIHDLTMLLANYGLTGDVEWVDGDLDFDTDVDLQDLVRILSLIGEC